MWYSRCCCNVQIMLPGSMNSAFMAISWTIMVACSVGLFFLYKTTTADPGLIPTGCVPAERPDAPRAHLLVLRAFSKKKLALFWKAHLHRRLRAALPAMTSV